MKIVGSKSLILVRKGVEYLFIVNFQQTARQKAYKVERLYYCIEVQMDKNL